MGPKSPDAPSWSPRADGRLEDWPSAPAGERQLFERLRRLCEDGLDISARIDASRSEGWHSFVPADYETVLRALMSIRHRSGRFLELGSAIGVIAIMADMLGFDAYGVEIDPELVEEARLLAARYESNARFAVGSYLPAAYSVELEGGETRLGSILVGEPAYDELRLELSDFDWVYAYPWPGETEILGDVMRQRGKRGAQLMIHGYTGGVEFHPGCDPGRPVSARPEPDE